MHLANYSVVSAVILSGESFKDHLSPSQLSSWEVMSTLDEHHSVQVPSIQRMKASHAQTHPCTLALLPRASAGDDWGNNPSNK